MSTINLSQHNTKRVQVSLYNLLREVLIVVIAVTYAYILMSLPLFEFQDRGNYLVHAQSSEITLGSNQAREILILIFNEPIWLLINVWLKNILVDPENVMKTIIFMASFLSSYSFIKLSNSKIRNILLMVILLLLPIILKNYITHLRQGLAIGLFMLGMLFSDWRRIAFVIVTPFIHSSFFFVIFLTQIDRIISWFTTFKTKIRIPIVFTIGIILSLNLRRIAAFLGDRRADQYDFTTADVSGLGWLFWLIVLIVIDISGNSQSVTNTTF
ncbi:EpsG family protein [Cylindrospermopsis raciborskii]|uniref:EpsG family protein n=1 Tax=Cylindrospermopsis raciborskii TaxID=77022 RepID=UPI000C9EAADC|nr:EpsG family protein [Cylindrospermopsis raciborskii]PNK16495.1 hypothetical protein CEP07_10410 [Cylindrospermopsis raciborskii S01]